MSTVFNPTVTAAGKAAAINASNTGLELQLTHVAFGTGAYTPTGAETAMAAEVARVSFASGSRITPTQVRMLAAWQSDVGVYGITEIGLFAGPTLVAVWSTAAATIMGYKTPGVDCVFFYDLVLASLPANSVSVLVDSGQSAILVALGNHLNDQNAHPQYLKIADLPINLATTSDVLSAISAHANASDPHPGYMTQAEVDARIAAAGKGWKARAKIHSAGTYPDATFGVSNVTFDHNIYDNAVVVRVYLDNLGINAANTFVVLAHAHDPYCAYRYTNWVQADVIDLVFGYWDNQRQDGSFGWFSCEFVLF